MKIIFAGTPEFAALALRALHAAGHEIALVLTQPDRPAGRGMKLQMSAVKQAAIELNLPVAQPMSLKLNGRYPTEAQAAHNLIAAQNAEVMIVAAYGLILPQAVLDIPKRGCLNIHASILPRWRGAAPIQRAIEAGDTETGITIMQMDVGLDTGAMLALEKIAIATNDTSATMHHKLAELGARMVVQALENLRRGDLTPTPQPDQGVLYAAKIDKAEAALDWNKSAIELAQKIRAFNPAPVCTATLQNQTIKLWQAHALQNLASTAPAGTVLQADAAGIQVACTHGVLCLTELQKSGGKRLPAREFLQGVKLQMGDVFESTPTQ